MHIVLVNKKEEKKKGKQAARLGLMNA